LRGFSDASRADAPLHDPEADHVLIEAIKQHVDSRIDVIEIDCHINDDAFADAVIGAFRDISAPKRMEHEQTHRQS
jgi:uncharacterized protein (UPF0261 family)